MQPLITWKGNQSREINRSICFHYNYQFLQLCVNKAHKYGAGRILSPKLSSTSCYTNLLAQEAGFIFRFFSVELSRMPYLNCDFQELVAREESEKLFFPFFKGPEALPSFRSWFLWSPSKARWQGWVFPWEEVEGISTDDIIVLELVISLKVTLAFASPDSNLTLQRCLTEAQTEGNGGTEESEGPESFLEWSLSYCE